MIAILKWYHTQRTRFTKLREGQSIRKSHKRSGDDVSSGDEEDPILVEEVSENDSDHDRFIGRVFGFLKPQIKRHKRDTPASVSMPLKFKLKLIFKLSISQLFASKYNLQSYFLFSFLFLSLQFKDKLALAEIGEVE